jgi:hypothetical protein
MFRVMPRRSFCTSLVSSAPRPPAGASRADEGGVHTSVPPSPRVCTWREKVAVQIRLLSVLPHAGFRESKIHVWPRTRGVGTVGQALQGFPSKE